MARPRRQLVRRTVLYLLLLAFPIVMNYYSPVLIMMAASEGVANFSLFLWVAWLVVPLAIGRLACAWICPLGAVQEVKDRMAELPLTRVRYLRVAKVVFAVAWVGAIVFFAVSAGGYKRVNLLYSMESGVSVESLQNLIMYTIVLLVPLLPALFLGKRAFCHYFCPFGVLNTATTRLARLLRLPGLRLRARPEACKQCGQCQRACPMSLPVMDMVQRGRMDNIECILCGSCVDTCKHSAVQYAWQAAAAAGRPAAGAISD